VGYSSHFLFTVLVVGWIFLSLAALARLSKLSLKVCERAS